jgi:hypothetical protein
MLDGPDTVGHKARDLTNTFPGALVIPLLRTRQSCTKRFESSEPNPTDSYGSC